MAPPSDADSTMARVSHEFADLPGDDGESQSLRRRRELRELLLQLHPR